MLYRKTSYADGVFDRYLFERDVFGNIISVYNIDTGAKVGSYCYDAWGNCTVLTNTNGIGAMNPFRYRGYYLDTETNLYYLQSRYYDSYVGRFINGDKQINSGLIGGNLFAYCANNPVKYQDPTGTMGELAGAIQETFQSAAPLFTIYLELTQVDSPAPGLADLAALTAAVVTAGVCIGIAVYKTATESEKVQTNALPDVRAKVKHGAIYQVAYINSRGELVRLYGKMTYEEAILALNVTSVMNLTRDKAVQHGGINKGLVWGIYTHDQAAAKALAMSFGGGKYTGWHGSGQYGHYHDDDEHHHFHIWFGGPIY